MNGPSHLAGSKLQNHWLFDRGKTALSSDHLHLWKHPIYVLQKDSGLSRFRGDIRVLNPRLVKKFKGPFADLPKNDVADTLVIADHLHFGWSNRDAYMYDCRYKALQILTKFGVDVIQNLTQEK